ncbi:MAG: hypothetical protein IPP33_06130 [Flavobacteriales bacterium]|nr:hypothetical protein [Flavobacteriales bacterium]
MANTADVNIGSYIRFNNDICQINGNGSTGHQETSAAFYQGKMRNLRNILNEHRWH